MDKVVILARVSTDKQEYQRQVNELKDYCNRVGWSVEAAFCNKVSGAKTIEERRGRWLQRPADNRSKSRRYPCPLLSLSASHPLI